MHALVSLYTCIAPVSVSSEAFHGRARGSIPSDRRQQQQQRRRGRGGWGVNSNRVTTSTAPESFWEFINHKAFDIPELLLYQKFSFVITTRTEL